MTTRCPRTKDQSFSSVATIEVGTLAINTALQQQQNKRKQALPSFNRR